MKFDVTYLRSDFNFKGEGEVFVNDTALICKGNIPKFNLGFLSTIYQKVLYVSTTRTIPYAIILQYKKPGALSNAHVITYRLPNGKKVTIKFEIFDFRMTKPEERHSEMFTSQLEEYLAVAQSFIGS